MQVLQPVMNKSWVHNRNEKMKIKKPLLASTKRGLSGLQWILRLLPIDYYRSTIVTRASTHIEAPKN